MSYIDIDNLDIDHVIANSFKRFHVPSIDYICLKRTEDDTIKLYFFEDAAVQSSEVVNPHWHRYDFRSTAITGEVENIWYERGLSSRAIDNPMRYERFDYRTPLLGGDGFTHRGSEYLYRKKAEVVGDYWPSKSYFMRFDEIHTINILQPETCLMLHQFRDMVPAGIPTETFMRTGDPPNLNDGLYEKFTADEVIKKLKWLNEKVGKK